MCRPQFYLTFWSLSMSDLQVPEHAYKRRITLLELEMSQIDERKELVREFALSLPWYTCRLLSDCR